MAADEPVEALAAVCQDLDVPTLQAHGIDKDQQPRRPTVDEIQDLCAQIRARHPASEEHDGHDSQIRAETR
ncbi:hypothetical protein PV963_01970 [Streptomyces coeruleorubidus]|uniref:hypothetical protein n=1 Tax=Streptomyces coeruleorubidus TaxID=116188 RepID=UPI00237F58D7|nr:hypothetical protein [Streptomyces coeruleorubidus]WDV49287.1 hypothetical protein PV963_01970 [Streptomyces coeruleorubidus]